MVATRRSARRSWKALERFAGLPITIQRRTSRRKERMNGSTRESTYSVRIYFYSLGISARRIRIMDKLAMGTAQHTHGAGERGHSHGHGHSHGDHDHDHSHGVVDPSIATSERGLWAVKWSGVLLLVVSFVELAVVAMSGSTALLADMIHNFGDALTAVPLGIAFFLRSARGEKVAGLFVVLAIAVSATVALVETILRFIRPQDLHHLAVLAAAGVVGFIGNEIAARVRLRGGRRLGSPALIADGNHARIDAFVSLAVIGSAIAAWLGAPILDPVIGLAITLVILKITWDSWKTVRHAEIDIEHIDNVHDRDR